MITHLSPHGFLSRERRSLLALALLLILFAGLAYAIRLPGTRPWDASVTRAIQTTENPLLTSLSRDLFEIGAGRGLCILLVPCGLYLWLTRRPVGAMFQATTILGHVLDSWIKGPFNRPRPLLSDGVQVILPADGSSFPSGHTMAAVMFFGFFAVQLARGGGNPLGRWVGMSVCVVMALLIGISRIYLGDHFLTDVAGGYVAGLFFWILWISVYRRAAPAEFAGADTATPITPP